MSTRVAISLAIGLSIGYVLFMMKLDRQNSLKRMNDIHWTNFQIEGWVNYGDTQQVCKVIMGLRKDGMLVWKEVLMNGQRSSCVMFETPDAEDQKVIISHVGPVKFVPPEK